MTFLQQKLDHVTSSFKCFQKLSMSLTKAQFLTRFARFFIVWVNFQLSFYSDLNYMLKLYFVIVAQSCPTLCDPMDSGLSGFSAHGDFPAKNALLHKLYFTTFKSGICHVLSLHSLTYDSFSTSVRPSCLFIVLLSHCYYQFFFFFNWWFTLFFFFW